MQILGAAYGLLSINDYIGHKQKRIELGGDSYFAFLGIRACGLQAKIISGIGKDLLDSDDFMKDLNGSDFYIRTDLSIHNEIGESGEIESIYEPDFTQYNENAQRLFTSQFNKAIENISFLYFSDATDNTNARYLSELKEKNGFEVMWQIPFPNSEEEKELVNRNRNLFDAITINRRNAAQLFNINDRQEILKKLSEWDTPVVFIDDSGELELLTGGKIYESKIRTGKELTGFDLEKIEAVIGAVIGCLKLNGDLNEESLKRAVKIAEEIVLNKNICRTKEET